VIQELRRFKVWDERGTMFYLREVVDIEVIDGEVRQLASPKFLTLSDQEAIPTSNPGEFRIPRAALVVSETKPGPH